MSRIKNDAKVAATTVTAAQPRQSTPKKAVRRVADEMSTGAGKALRTAAEKQLAARPFSSVPQAASAGLHVSSLGRLTAPKGVNALQQQQGAGATFSTPVTVPAGATWAGPVAGATTDGKVDLSRVTPQMFTAMTPEQRASFLSYIKSQPVAGWVTYPSPGGAMVPPSPYPADQALMLNLFNAQPTAAMAMAALAADPSSMGLAQHMPGMRDPSVVQQAQQLAAQKQPVDRATADAFAKLLQVHLAQLGPRAPDAAHDRVLGNALNFLLQADRALDRNTNGAGVLNQGDAAMLGSLVQGYFKAALGPNPGPDTVTAAMTGLSDMLQSNPSDRVNVGLVAGLVGSGLVNYGKQLQAQGNTQVANTVMQSILGFISGGGLAATGPTGAVAAPIAGALAPLLATLMQEPDIAGNLSTIANTWESGFLSSIVGGKDTGDVLAAFMSVLKANDVG